MFELADVVLCADWPVHSLVDLTFGLAVLLRRCAGAGRTSWTAFLDAVRSGAADDATAVTALHPRDVVARLTTVGH